MCEWWHFFDIIGDNLIHVEQNMKEVMIYTDGACSGNPGPGGWAALLMFGEHKKGTIWRGEKYYE